MASAVTPRWHGDNYQARVFWENALSLLDHTSCVVEVTFEADGPKAFDDVVVKYDPPLPGSGPLPVPAEYQQVKWHVEYGGRFGYEDFTKPEFIGATRVSLLERLRDAKTTAPTGSRFSFITVYRISDHDPLAELISASDKSLLVEKLFDDTTDRSRLGKVRKCWREHLQLTDDEALRAIVTGLRVFEGHRSLDDLRSSINWRAKVVGLMSFDDTSDFRYDGLAQALKMRQMNAVSRATLEEFCKAEGVWVGPPKATDDFLPVAIRSFEGTAADVSGATPANTLLLTGEFRQRYLRDDRDWQRDIRPKVEVFLRDCVKRSARLRLILDAHASLAFLAGRILDLKSGVTVELVQKGRVGSSTWRADDGSGRGAAKLAVTTTVLGSGRDIAAVISIAQDAEVQARAYIAPRLPEIGQLLVFTPPSGASHQAVAGGGHAALLTEQIAQALRTAKTHGPDATVHLFAAAPNSLLFYLGQQHQGISPCVIYEYDFDRGGNKTYQPSIVME